MSGWKLVGISDESTECEVCGRVELKATYHLVLEDGSELRAGSSCAARKLGTKAADITRAGKVYRLRMEIARSNFPDYFRQTMGASIVTHRREYPEAEKMRQGMYRRYMLREGFTV
jgi:ribosome-binding protein aMBF1 (putative translation factor)